jgi:Tol biopolymer transport system component
VIFTTRSGEDVASPFHLYRLTIASGETARLTSGADVYDTSPAVSTDGRWLAFVRHDGSAVHARGTLMVQSLKPAASQQQPIEVPVPSTPNGVPPAYVIHSPSWSQDGRFLTFVLGNDLFEWEHGAQASRLVYAGAGRLVGLTLAGDLPALTMVRGSERNRAVIGSIEQSSDIFALPVSPDTHEALGPAVPRFESTAGDIQPSFSPDGRVAFVSARDGARNVWVAPSDGGDPKRLTDLQSPIVGFPRWAPDGRRIAFHASDGAVRQIHVVKPDAGVPQRIAEGCCAAWSTDGTHLYATDLAAQPALSRIRVSDGQREPLFPGAFASLTADGATLLYGKVGEQNLYARALDGDLRSNPEEVLLTDSAYPSAIAPTADGFFYIAYSAAGEPGRIRFYDYATRESRLIARTPAGVAEVLSLSSDETELLYSAQRTSGADLWLLEFDATVR